MSETVCGRKYSQHSGRGQLKLESKIISSNTLRLFYPFIFASPIPYFGIEPYEPAMWVTVVYSVKFTVKC